MAKQPRPYGPSKWMLDYYDAKGVRYMTPAATQKVAKQLKKELLRQGMQDILILSPADQRP